MKKTLKQNSKKVKEFDKKAIKTIINKNNVSRLLLGLLGTATLGIHSSIEAFPANFDLNQLNGQNGFSLSGQLIQGQAEESGFSVSGAGDVNGDGFDDLIIGAPQAKVNSYDLAGRTYVVFGKNNTPGSPANIDLGSLNGANGFTIHGETVFDRIGWSVSGAGDVNGDEIDDLITGARFGTPDPIAYSGQSYVIFGRTNGFPADIQLDIWNQPDGQNGFQVFGDTFYDYAGTSVSKAGDFNGDGFSDILVGAPDHPSSPGSAYIIYGHNNPFPAVLNLSGNPKPLDGSNGFEFGGDIQMGRSVSDAGDVNGDGYDDIIVGAPEDLNLAYPGSAYVLFGGFYEDPFAPYFNVGLLNGANGFEIIGPAAGKHFGLSVSGIGDINGDGVGDLAVASPHASPNGNNSGQVYIVFGRFAPFPADLHLGNLSNTEGFIINGKNLDDNVGFAVNGAGDFDGDKVDDFIIGAPQAAQKGKAYVILGNKNGFPFNFDLNTLDGKNGFTVNGKKFNDLLGKSVKAAGDVNGDDIDDIMLGAPGFDFFFNEGQSYVIYGDKYEPGDFDEDGQVDVLIQNGVRVYAALMTNGTYTGIKKVLISFLDQQKVVGAHDFNLDKHTDLVTQLGQSVKILLGPTFLNVYAGANLPLGEQVVATGDLLTGNDPYIPDVITRRVNSYYLYELWGNGFSPAQLIYNISKSTELVDIGRFLKPQPSEDEDVLLQSGSQVIASCSTNANFLANYQLITMLPPNGGKVLGSGDFVQIPSTFGKMEVIWTNNTQVMIGIKACGYTLATGDKVVGPK